jgi:hypothetical protein
MKKSGMKSMKLFLFSRAKLIKMKAGKIDPGK